MQVTIQQVTPKKQGTGAKGPWTISEVITDQGSFDTFDSFTVGEVANVDVKPNPNPKYNANIKRVNWQSSYQNTKNAEVSNKIIEQNSAKEERITMLSCLSTAASFYRERQADEDKMIAFALKIYKVAMNQKDELPF